MIEFDVETTSLQHHGAKPGELFLASFLGRSDNEADLRPHPREREAIQNWLKQDLPFRGWNTKFDLHWLKQAGYTLPPESQWHDGMVGAHIMDERTSVALQARGNKLFGEGAAAAHTEQDVKGWLAEETKRRRKAAKESGEEFVEPNYSDVPWHIMSHYAAHDVVLTRQIGDVYARPLEKDFAKLYKLEQEVLASLFWMEDRGIPMDRTALARLEGELLPRLDELEANCINEAQFDNFNPRSPKQISEALDRMLKEARKAHRETGGPSPENDGVEGESIPGQTLDFTKYMTRQASGLLKTDSENLEACDHPLAEAILAYRGEHKLYAMLRGILHDGSGDGKFPSAYLTGEDRVHPNFRQLGARTGRMSCSNPNFQQVPRDDLRLRYAVAARPGHKLVCCDLDSIELRLLAAFAGEGRMREAILRGDVHQQTADFLGLTGRRRSTGALEGPRDQGKRMNYLIVYGGGVRAIRKFFGLPQAEAQKVLHRMHEAYPEIGELQNNIEFALEDRGFVRSPLTDRRFRLQYDVHKEGYKFLNYLIQGTAADVLKIGLVRCHKAGIPVVAVVHDEIIAEVPDTDAAEAAATIEDCMTRGFDVITEKVPFAAEAQIVDRWSEAKKTDYVPTYMED